MKQTDLLSCPFCGKKITENSLDIDNDNYWSVYCICGVKNGNYKTPDEAKIAWNKRIYKLCEKFGKE